MLRAPDGETASHLVLTSALLLSLKFYGSDRVPHTAQKLALAGKVPVKLLLRKELEMVQVLRWRVWSSTPWTFLNTSGIDEELRAVVQSVLLSSLGRVSLRRYPASLIAASARFVGNARLGRAAWTATDEELTWYSQRQLQRCADDLVLSVTGNASSA